MQAQITASIGEHTVSTNESTVRSVNLTGQISVKTQSQKITDLNDSLQEETDRA